MLSHTLEEEVSEFIYRSETIATRLEYFEGQLDQLTKELHGLRVNDLQMTDKRQTRQQVANILKGRKGSGRLTDPFSSKPLVSRSPKDKSFSSVTPNPRSSDNSDEDQDVDQTLASKSLINFNISDQNLPTMAQPSTQRATNGVDQKPIFQASLKDALSVVPEFNGKNIPLSEFLEGCNEAREILGPYDEANLVRLIRSRVKGEARAAILGSTFPTIESFKDFLKDIYASNKTEQQLLGELGNEYQRDNESVIAFANRMRDLGAQINEAHKIATGALDPEFRAQTEAHIVECFKQGLKPEIENKMKTTDNISDIVKNAILAERQIASKAALRDKQRPHRRGLFYTSEEVTIPQPQRVPETRYDARATRMTMCRFCNKPGHSEETCFLKAKTCQICKKPGHTANLCRNDVVCQICEQKGHTAAQCNKNRRVVDVCQLCNKPGHLALNCFQRTNNSPRAEIRCFKCDKPGHTAAVCRQQNPNNKASIPICSYCQIKGHVATECRKRKYSQQAKNERSLPQQSATREAPQTQVRSALPIELEDFSGELVP